LVFPTTFAITRYIPFFFEFSGERVGVGNGEWSDFTCVEGDSSTWYATETAYDCWR